MPIVHRIFIPKHKRKKVFIARKKVYKKYLGLKTLKAVVYTKLSLPYHQPQLIKKEAKRARPKKRPVVKKPRKVIKFRMLKSLAPQVRRQEVRFAQGDIDRFKNILAQAPEEKKAPEEKFQAFVPRKIWSRMSSEQRRLHIKKRKEFAIKKLDKTTASPVRYVFSNRPLRPLLAKLRSSERKRYLKNLIKFARRDVKNSKPVPFEGNTTQQLAIKVARKGGQRSKKLQPKSAMNKKTNYASPIAGVINNLIF